MDFLTREDAHVRQSLLVLYALGLLALGVRVSQYDPANIGPDLYQRYITVHACVAVSIAAGLVLLWRNHLMAGLLAGVTAALAGIVTSAAYLGNGIHAPSLVFLPLLVLGAHLRYRTAAGLLALLIALGLLAVLAFAQHQGWLIEKDVPIRHSVLESLSSLMMATVFCFFIGRAFTMRARERLQILEEQQTALKQALASAESAQQEMQQLVAQYEASNKALEAALQARDQTLRELETAEQEKEAASQAKSRFLSMMSHEIRTPVSGIRAALHLLKHPKSSRVLKQSYLQAIENASGSLLRFMDDMLEATNLNRGQAAFVKRPFRIPEVIEDTLTLFAIPAQDKSLTLSFECDRNLPDVVSGDSARVRQMLAHLVGNAIKFTDKGGIRVMAEPDQSASGGQDVCVFRVCDTGPGISPEHQQRLFEPFEALEEHEQNQTSGRGLGLALVAQLAQMMGGDAGVNSQPGAGSEFWFRLPLPTVSSQSTNA